MLMLFFCVCVCFFCRLLRSKITIFTLIFIIHSSPLHFHALSLLISSQNLPIPLKLNGKQRLDTHECSFSVLTVLPACIEWLGAGRVDRFVKLFQFRTPEPSSSRPRLPTTPCKTYMMHANDQRGATLSLLYCKKKI